VTCLIVQVCVLTLEAACTVALARAACQGVRSEVASLPMVEAKWKSSPLAGAREMATKSMANMVGLTFEATHAVALASLG
jgi:hypothetical protein